MRGQKLVLSDDRPKCRIETEMRNYFLVAGGNLTPLTLMIFEKKKPSTLNDLTLKWFLF